MQIPDTFMVSCIGRDLCYRHDLPGIRSNRVLKTVRLPVCHKGSVYPDMRNADPPILLDGIEKTRYRFTHFHQQH
jgi:hypothetical protein